jgi:hypothetical protein
LQNPITVAQDFVQAGAQGVQAFVNDLGGLVPATTLAPTSGPSTLAKAQAPTNSTPATTLTNSVVQLGGADKAKDKLSGQSATSNANAARPKPLKALADLASNLSTKPGNLFKPQTKQKSPSESTPGLGTSPLAGENQPAATSQDAAA